MASALAAPGRREWGGQAEPQWEAKERPVQAGGAGEGAVSAGRGDVFSRPPSAPCLLRSKAQASAESKFISDWFH